MKDRTIIENLKDPKKFVSSTIDVMETFLPQKTFTNSWFFIGDCKVDGHDISFLFHMMAGRFINQLNGVFSVTDKTTGWYESSDCIIPLRKHMHEKDGTLTVKTDNAEMNGNLKDGINIKAKLKKCSFNAFIKPYGDVILNGGSGYYPLLLFKNNAQYSCPNMKMDGSVTIEGKEYEFRNTECWFDRQFNSPIVKDIIKNGVKLDDRKWIWFGLKLDNNVSMSIWEILDADGTDNNFGTVLLPDGTQNIFMPDSLVENCDDVWHSDVTRQNYPTKWKVKSKLPNMDLLITCVPREQEIVSERTDLNKYEGESIVTGIYMGEEVTGSCCVEILGNWQNFKK